MTNVATLKTLSSWPGSGQTAPGWLLNPGVLPTLDIDFVNNRAWNGAPTTIPALLASSTRGTSGYYTTAGGVLVNFPGLNTVRYGDNGILVEEQRTNLLLQSNTFTATWTTNAITNLTTTTTGPDNLANSATLINETVANGTHQVSQNVAKAASAIAYSFSVYAKVGVGRTRLFMQLDNGAGGGATVTFDLAGVQIGVAAANIGSFTAISAAISQLGTTGWCLCQLNATSDTQTTLNANFRNDNGSGTGAASNSYAGTVGNGVYIYGAQLEQGGFATSYIPTLAATATRNADSIIMLMSPANQGVVYAALNYSNIAPTSRANTHYLSSSGSALVTGWVSTLGGNATFFNTDNSSNNDNVTFGSGLSGNVKLAYAYGQTLDAGCGNGGTVTAGTAPGTFNGLNAVYVGSNAASSFWINGYIQRFALFSTRPSNTILQNLTT